MHKAKTIRVSPVGDLPKKDGLAFRCGSPTRFLESLRNGDCSGLESDVREVKVLPKSAPRIPRDTEPCSLVGFIGIASGMVAVVALALCAAGWSVSELVRVVTGG